MELNHILKELNENFNKHSEGEIGEEEADKILAKNIELLKKLTEFDSRTEIIDVLLQYMTSYHYADKKIAQEVLLSKDASNVVERIKANLTSENESQIKETAKALRSMSDDLSRNLTHPLVVAINDELIDTFISLTEHPNAFVQGHILITLGFIGLPKNKDKILPVLEKLSKIELKTRNDEIIQEDAKMGLRYFKATLKESA